MSPSILTERDRCRLSCAWTAGWTSPSIGDVQRCEHERVWAATGEERRGYFGNRIYRWRRLSWLWTPIVYRRAIAALAGEERDR